MSCANPESTEPIVKIVIAIWNSSFLLNRSASLPQIGVVAVDASSVEVMTQVYWVWLPLRSARIVGRALATIVELRIATSSASRIPDRASRILRWVMGVASVIEWPPGPAVGNAGRR